VFKEERQQSHFDWTMIGDVAEGRPNLGPMTHIAVYRLMQFTLRDTLIQQFGVAEADRIFYESGKTAGMHFCKKLITQRDSFSEFINQLQDILKSLGVGLLRIEKADLDQLTFTMTVAEDLDCSGLPICDEEICTYDEGFIAGILKEYTDREFIVKEIDCWCSGDRVCRFDVKPAL